MNEKTKLSNFLTTDQIRELDNMIQISLMNINRMIMDNYKMDDTNGDHMGRVLMCMRHLNSLTSHILWKINSQGFYDDGYWREKIGKLQKELNNGDESK